MPQHASAKVSGHMEPSRAHAMSLSMVVLGSDVSLARQDDLRGLKVAYTVYSITPVGVTSALSARPLLGSGLVFVSPWPSRF